ncbi:MAG: cellulase family glycosylhydrolase [Polyangiaceae bacterium]
MSTNLNVSQSSLLAIAILSSFACAGTDEGTGETGGTSSTLGGATAASAVGGNSSVSSTGSASGGAITGTSTKTQAMGGQVAAGGATSTVARGGTASVGGTSAKAGATSTGGSSAFGGTSAAGGTTAKGGTTAMGGTSAKGGTSAIGGTSARGGTSSTGGTTAAGGTTGAGGTSSGCTATGFYVSGTKIYDSKCNPFVMRGVNYPYAWFTGQNTQARFAEIASTKANTIRVVLSGGRWTPTSTAANVTSIISWAKANNLIAMLEVHDCTGYGDSSASGAANPDTCVAYWLQSAMVTALKGNEAYVMINIANEAFGNISDNSQWESFYTTSVPKFRTAGLNHTLVVDAPNWAQDWKWTMRDGSGATNIFNADPKRNVVFSVHMYNVFNTATLVTNYFSKFLTKNVPLIVGEFAADHGSAGDVDEATILSASVQSSIGYLGWSWSGNSGDLATLDITNSFNLSSLTTWGSRLIDGANGIRATGTPCTVFQ